MNGPKPVDLLFEFCSGKLLFVEFFPADYAMRRKAFLGKLQAQAKNALFGNLNTLGIDDKIIDPIALEVFHDGLRVLGA